MTNALATPPAKRNNRNRWIAFVSAMAMVVTALVASALSNQRRRLPGTAALAEPKAPKR